MNDQAASVQSLRIERLRARMEVAEIDVLLVSSPSNLRYLSGFSGGEGLLLVKPDDVLFASDSRYTLQAEQEAPGVRFMEVNDPMPQVLPTLLGKESTVVGVESGWVTLATWKELEPALEGRPRRLIHGMVEELRRVKDDEEIPHLRRAGALAASSLDYLASRAVLGRTEAELALELEFHVRSRGSEGVPFAYIVAGGERGAMPHALPSEYRLREGDLIVIDFGAVVGGYASDMTRTFGVGSLSEECRRMHHAVQQAQAAAVGAVCAGVRCAEIDAIARNHLEKAGVPGVFRHSVGHGVGLEVHEAPRLSQSTDDVLEAGMVVTIEPAVYVADVGGVRIEDTVLVTPDGCEVLTEWERGLLTLT